MAQLCLNKTCRCHSKAGVRVLWIVKSAHFFMNACYKAKDQSVVRAKAVTLINQHAPNDPRDFIRDPYIIEFIGAQPNATFYEKELCVYFGIMPIFNSYFKY